MTPLDVPTLDLTIYSNLSVHDTQGGERPSPCLYRGEILERHLKGLSHEIDFENVDENGQIFALIRAAAGF